MSVKVQKDQQIKNNKPKHYKSCTAAMITMSEKEKPVQSDKGYALLPL